MSLKKVITPTGETKWDVRVYENGRESNRVFKRFDRRIDAENFIAATKEAARQGQLSPFGAINFKDYTFTEEANSWIEDGKMRFSESHTKRAEGVLKELLPAFGCYTMDKFTPEFMGKYQRSEFQKGLSEATVNRKCEVILAILNYSVRNRHIPFNPANGFRKLRKKPTDMKFWNPDDAMDFLACMNKAYPTEHELRWVYVVYLLALNTGMRAGEIWGLRVNDFSHDHETLKVRQQYNRVSNEFGPTKGRNTRLVPCPVALREELIALKSKHDLGNMDTFFRNENGKPICHDNFSKRQFIKDMELWGKDPKIRFHDLRHTAITLMIANGVDIKTVQSIAGHADISTTMGYIHLIHGSVNKVAQTFSVEPKPEEVALAQLKLVK